MLADRLGVAAVSVGIAALWLGKTATSTVGIFAELRGCDKVADSELF